MWKNTSCYHHFNKLVEHAHIWSKRYQIGSCLLPTNESVTLEISVFALTKPNPAMYDFVMGQIT